MKIKHLKSNMKRHQTKLVSYDNEVKTLNRRFVIVAIDKATNNYALICKRFYINRLLVVVRTFSNSSTKTYLKVDTSKEDIINTNLKHCFNFGMTVVDKQKDLLIIHWLPKMYKTPIGYCFMEASKQLSIKPLTKTISNIFKLICSDMESFHNKIQFVQF